MSSIGSAREVSGIVCTLQEEVILVVPLFVPVELDLISKIVHADTTLRIQFRVCEFPHSL